MFLWDDSKCYLIKSSKHKKLEFITPHTFLKGNLPQLVSEQLIQMNMEKIIFLISYMKPPF